MPPPGSNLHLHRRDAQALLRRKYPSLSEAAREDVLPEARLRVLARLGRGPLADERPYLLRVVFTVAAGVLAGRRAEVLTAAEPATSGRRSGVHGEPSALA